MSKLIKIIGAIILALVCIYIGVLFDQPAFIKAIPGKDFTKIWGGYYAVVVAITVVLCIKFLKCCVNRIKKEFDESVEFTESEMFEIFRFSKYRKVAYRIMKMCNDGIIETYDCEEERPPEFKFGLPRKVQVLYVHINKEKTEEEIEEYCKKNPLASHIIDNVKFYERSRENVEAEMVINRIIKSTPDYRNKTGFYKKRFQKMIRVSCVGISVAYYPAITKLMMGIYNNKPVGDLASTMFSLSFLGLVVAAAYGTAYENAVKNAQCFLLEKLTQKKEKLYCYLFSTRAFEMVKEENTDALLGLTIGTALMVERAASRSTDGSSCSSCGSSCSSCGSSCSSCGGCGND